MQYKTSLRATVGGSSAVLSWTVSHRMHTQTKQATKLGRTILAHAEVTVWLQNLFTGWVTEAGSTVLDTAWDK